MYHPAVLEFSGVGKCYGAGPPDERAAWALRGVDLKVGPGEVLGLLGPNRAGKTTLAKLALSLCAPTEGRVVRFDRPASDRRTLARVGYAPEAPAFPTDMTAEGLLWYLGAVGGLPRSALRERVPGLLRRFGLDDRAREPVGRFSKGMLRRLSLAQALLGEPSLFVADEPTEGLDLDGLRRFRGVVAELSAGGCAVVLITHMTAEVEHLCTRAAVLVAGRKVYDGPLDDLPGRRRGDQGKGRGLEPCLAELYQGAAV
ncbi:MAG: ABC transporter ATP-binding protein [Isosphaeraceae bacterium]